MSEHSADKKRKPNYLSKNNKRKKFALQPGMKGFLCSCNFREKDCIREAYNILNCYADKMIAVDKPPQEAEVSEIEDEIQKELASLKAENATGSTGSGRKFQIVESGAKNFLFISTTVEDPVKLAEVIVKDVYETKEKQFRFLIRLVPIEVVCKAYIEDIKKAFAPLVDKYFQESAQSFSIAFNHRNNNELSRDIVIKELAAMVTGKRSDHVVNLTEAKVTIVVEIIRGMALLGVVPHYLQYKKYNLHVNSNTDEEKEAKNTPAEDDKAEPEIA